MPRYITNAASIAGGASPPKTFLTVLTPSNRRCRIVAIYIGSDDTPASNAAKWVLKRITTDGTGTAVTPNPVDVAETASLCTSKQNYTVEPTYATETLPAIPFFPVALNQQATMPWVFFNDPLSQPIAAISTGFGLVMVTGPNAKFTVAILFDE